MSSLSSCPAKGQCPVTNAIVRRMAILLRNSREFARNHEVHPHESVIPHNSSMAPACVRPESHIIELDCHNLYPLFHQKINRLKLQTCICHLSSVSDTHVDCCVPEFNLSKTGSDTFSYSCLVNWFYFLKFSYCRSHF